MEKKLDISGPICSSVLNMKTMTLFDLKVPLRLPYVKSIKKHKKNSRFGWKKMGL